MNLHRFFVGRAVGFLIVVIVGGAGYWIFSHTSKNTYTFVPVIRGEIIHEASASGKVEAPTQIDLYFKNSGRLSARTAEIGDEVKEGQVLARQDTRELQAQRQEVEAGVDVQRARLAQLLAGDSNEDITITQTAVENAQQTVADAKAAAIKAIQDAYTKADDAVRTKADVVFADPHIADPQISFIVNNSQVELMVELQRKNVEQALQSWSVLRAQLGASTDLDADIQSSQQYLQQVTTLLDYVAQALNAHISGVTGATLDTWKASISTARTTANTSAASLVAAAETLKSAEGALASAKDALALKQAPARTADIALYQAQIREAEARIGSIDAKIAETRLVAPTSGIVTKADGEAGEVVGPDRRIVSLTPAGALQIKLNVSENNIAGVEVGQKVRITLDAFPNGLEWRGTVVAIDPAETIVGGAVYYETTVLFDEADTRIKSGMTANAWIVTATNESALYVPASALERRDDGTYVRVRTGSNDDVADRRVEIGIEGKQGVVEILSGLSEGDQVVTGGGV